MQSWSIFCNGLIFLAPTVLYINCISTMSLITWDCRCVKWERAPSTRHHILQHLLHWDEFTKLKSLLFTLHPHMEAVALMFIFYHLTLFLYAPTFSVFLYFPPLLAFHNLSFPPCIQLNLPQTWRVPHQLPNRPRRPNSTLLTEAVVYKVTEACHCGCYAAVVFLSACQD